MTRKLLKQNAKRQIKGKIGILFVMILLATVIMMVSMMIPVVSYFIYFILIAPGFSLSLTMI